MGAGGHCQGWTGGVFHVELTAMKKHDRIEQLLEAAMRVARASGYQQVSVSEIARQAGCTHPLVSHYLGTLASIKRTIMRRAVDKGDLVVLGQGLIARDRFALKAPEHMREQAMAAVMAGMK